jgi:hypothetical protein
MKIKAIWTMYDTSFEVGAICEDGFEVGSIDVNLFASVRQDWFLINDDKGNLKKLFNPAHVISVDVE